METITENNIKKLWITMASIYGHKWISNFGASDAGDIWFRGLHDLCPQHLAQGLGKCIERADPWPPSLPEFRHLCLGLPERSLIIHRAISPYKAPDAVSGRLKELIGSWALSHDSEQVLQKKANALYEQAVNDILPEVIIETRDKLLKLTG